jgi:hypothetical protein
MNDHEIKRTLRNLRTDQPDAYAKLQGRLVPQALNAMQEQLRAELKAQGLSEGHPEDDLAMASSLLAAAVICLKSIGMQPDTFARIAGDAWERTHVRMLPPDRGAPGEAKFTTEYVAADPRVPGPCCPVCGHGVSEAAGEIRAHDLEGRPVQGAASSTMPWCAGSGLLWTEHTRGEPQGLVN